MAIGRLKSLNLPHLGGLYALRDEKLAELIKGTSKNVIPVKTGIQKPLISLDSRLRGSDKLVIIRGSLKSSGYYRLKANRIKNFLSFLHLHYAADLDRMFMEDTAVLRENILTVKGIGPYTADTLLLYAAEKPTFVVDTYTKRIFSRHGWISEQDSYEDIRRYFMENLDKDLRLFNKYHALLVHLGKVFCRNQPICPGCPLESCMSARRRGR